MFKNCLFSWLQADNYYTPEIRCYNTILVGKILFQISIDSVFWFSIMYLIVTSIYRDAIGMKLKKLINTGEIPWGKESTLKIV